VDGGGADGDDVLVDHHEGEATVAVERVLLMKIEDGLLLFGGEPVIAGDAPVVLVGLPVALFPRVELPAMDADPRDEAAYGDLCPLGPLRGEVDDGVADVGGSPA